MTQRVIAACGCLLWVVVASFAGDCPELLGQLPDWASRVAVSGHYAYIGGPSELTVADVSDPSAPLVAGELGLPNLPLDIAVSGSHAYVADGYGLRVIDVSSPSDPVEVAFLDTRDYTHGVAVSDGYAYVTYRDPSSSEGGLQVIDVIRPSEPVEVGFVDTPAPAFAVAVSGGYAYVACPEGYSGGGGLYAIDVRRPTAPARVGFWNANGNAVDVAVSGSYAHVAGDDGLWVIDVSTPSAPGEVGYVDTPDSIWSVAASSGYAYIAWAGEFSSFVGLRVIDVSTPSAPVEVGAYDTPAERSGRRGVGVAVSGGSVFVAAAQAGLHVFRECATYETWIPAAALAAAAQGAFFQTDLEVNNSGTEEAELSFQWLPRGEDNSEPFESEPIALAPGQTLRYENVLADLFGLGPDSVGALKLVASTDSVIAMSRTYNIPGATSEGTVGQGLPAIRATEMIAARERRRILFLNENDQFRSNVGCQNGSNRSVRVFLELFDSDGESLEIRTMDLPPMSNNQITRVFRDHAPISAGYVDFWTNTEGVSIYCYGSVLDNQTSDPTTVLPQ